MGSVNNNISTSRRSTKLSFLYRWLFNRLNSLPISSIDVVRPDGVIEKLGKPTANTPVPQIRINRQDAVFKVIQGGMLGWAEAYMAADWDTPDLFALTDWAMANERALDNGFQGTFITNAFNRLLHVLRPNSRSGSKKNIAAHYDLGNSFYQQWLDSSMTYSSA
ncbi:class I SAM-dependent methyltransferase, partial [Endozoicomonas sp.]|nr:class I SAM-dependent methyltransferase [Endozoicomonas sp.]